MNHSVEEVLAKLEGAYAPNTLKGYRCDFGVFDRFCLERVHILSLVGGHLN